MIQAARASGLLRNIGMGITRTFGGYTITNKRGESGGDEQALNEKERAESYRQERDEPGHGRPTARYRFAGDKERGEPVHLGQPAGNG